MSMYQPHGRRGGRGRGFMYPPLNMNPWENSHHHVNPDSISGNYKLYVRSIPLSWNETILKNAFTIVGYPVSVFIGPPKQGFPYKWGFVEFATFDEARAAVQKMNNIDALSNIQVVFAREKPFGDDLYLDYVEDEQNNDEPVYEPTFIDAKMLSKTVKNDTSLSTSFAIDDYILKPVDEETSRNQELGLHLLILKTYELEKDGTCQVCEKRSCLACSQCLSTFYCSEECQLKDWSLHSSKCESSVQKSVLEDKFASQSKTQSQNGYKSYEAEIESKSDNRLSFNSEDRSRFGERRNNRFDNGGSNNKDNSRFNRDRSTKRNQNGVEPRNEQRNLFEERKSKFSLGKQGQTNSYNGRSTFNSVDSDKFTSNTQSKDEDDWGSSTQKSIEAKLIGERSQEKSSEIREPQKPTESDFSLTAGKVEEIQKPHKPVESGFSFTAGEIAEVSIANIESPFESAFVLPSKCVEKMSFISQTLNEPGAKYQPFSPVQGGTCISNFDGLWYRCKITSLNPLTVLYIDFGNSEAVTKDRLFAIPAEISTIPPLAIQVKFKNGLPDAQDSTFQIKPIEKVNDIWLVEIADADHTTSVKDEKEPGPVTESEGDKTQSPTSLKNKNIATPVSKEEILKKDSNLQEHPKKKPTLKLLPPEVFTKVFVRYRYDDDIAVTPVESVQDYNKLKTELQTLASTVDTITPQPSTRCITKCPVDKLWYRGRIKDLNPLTVYCVDIGEMKVCLPNLLRELPPQLASTPPFAVRVKARPGTPEEYTKSNTFLVKPLYKETNVWLVDVKPDVEAETTSSNGHVPDSPKEQSPTNTSHMSPNHQLVPSPIEVDVKPVITEPTFPHFLPKDVFSTVIITYGVEGQRDEYYVGSSNIWDIINDMAQYFAGLQHSELSNLQPGTLGLAVFELAWYRVRVVSMSPLQAYFVDFGNTETLKPEDIKICPNTHIDVPDSVHKIKLAPGTNEKYFSLPFESSISVKPVSLLADGTVVVHIEGETYNDTTLLGSAEQPESKLSSVSSSEACQNITMASSSSNGSPKNDESLKQDSSTFSIDLLEEGWEVGFIPWKLHSKTDSITGCLNCTEIPQTVNFIIDSNFETYMMTQPYDPNYKPVTSELVGCEIRKEWRRAKVLREGLVDLVDFGDVIQPSEMKNLSSEFKKVPFLAAVFTLHTQRPGLLDHILNMSYITLSVNKILDSNTGRLVGVTSKIGEQQIEGELVRWEYDPLMTPDPLSTGDLVNIATVINSNTFAVVPYDDRKALEKIQIECRKYQGEKFNNPPKEGDFVTYYCKESDVYSRSRVNKIIANQDEYELFLIDDSLVKTAKLESLHPMPDSLKKLSCRASKIQLKNVDIMEITIPFEAYVANLFEAETPLKIEYDEDNVLCTLIINESGEDVNKKLQELLKLVVNKDSNGKFLLQSLPELKPPFNQEVSFIVTQTDPLYMHIDCYALNSYYAELEPAIQRYCSKDNSMYNPAMDELCLAKFVDGNWYRTVCLKETNIGVSLLKLIDYGDLFDAPTSDIRQITKDMLMLPSLAIPCKIKGLPSEMSLEQLHQKLAINSVHKGFIEAEDNGCYEVRIPLLL